MATESNLPDMGRDSFEEVEKTGDPLLATHEGKTVAIVSRDTEFFCAHCICTHGKHPEAAHSIGEEHHQHFTPRGISTQDGWSDPKCVHKFECCGNTIMFKFSGDVNKNKKQHAEVSENVLWHSRGLIGRMRSVSHTHLSITGQRAPAHI